MSAFDLLAASLGLALSALAAALLLPLWRRAPVPAYRLVVSVLAAALALPLLQWAARALDLPVPHPARDLALAWGAGAPERLDPTFASAPLELVLPFDAAEEQRFAEGPAAQRATAAPVEATSASPTAPSGTARTFPWTTLLLAGWAAGALWAVVRTARRLLATRRLLARARPVSDAARVAVWDAVRAGSRTGLRTRLCESDEVRTPACAGLLRPAVVLPADGSLAGRPEVLACVLTHELVHLERRDPWVLLGEELLRAAFWFHPAAWWLVGRLAALRELSCDCLVVRRTGKRKRYASALVEYATWMQGTAPRASWAAVVPWSESRGHLTRRIEMLLQPQNQPKSGRVFAPAAVGVLMTFLWSGQLALATSSCAGTRSGHEHEHAHAAHQPAPDVCEGDACQVQVVVHDDEEVVLATTHGDESISAPGTVSVARTGTPLVYRVHGEKAQADDGGDVKRVERCVVVLSDGEGEPKVLRGAEAKAWIEEHGVHAKLGTSEQAVAEIRGALRDARGAQPKVIVIDGEELEGEEVEVIVVRPGEVRHAQGKKAAGFSWQQGQSALPRRGYGIGFGDGAGAQGRAGQTWILKGHPVEGEPTEGFYAPKLGKSFRFSVEGAQGGGHGELPGKVHGEMHGDVHGKVHGEQHGQGHGAGAATGFFGERGESAELDALRHELEKTRQALEEQRQALEELKQMLQKQRAKADAVGSWER
jgi:beta-lactamase regulating signal transducer with metallopeptidase domain